MLLILFFFFSFFLSIIIFMAGLIFSMKMAKDSEKSSPFECGFDPMGSSRIPFSTRFFLLAVIFLVFDIEIALIMPFPMLLFMEKKMELILSGMVFLMILLVGLLHEWREGSLDWKE